ncbi:MAG: CpaF family protein [Clostridiales bacterium]
MFNEVGNEKFIENIIDSINGKINLNSDINDGYIKKTIENEVMEKLNDSDFNSVYQNKIVDNVFNSIRRLDIIQPLIEDIEIDEIMINGYKDIFVEKKGEITKINTSFDNLEKLYNIISNIVGKVNREVNESNPIVDARLEDGSRVNIVLPPIALNGPIITIRKFKKSILTIKDLIDNKTVNLEISKFLELLVLERHNIMISGSTGAGKTTLLNIISNFIPKEERIITIEDSAELKIDGIKNIVKLETRNSNSLNVGNISIRDLIRTSLRMRPDRIIVGEVRGIEAIDMLQAMNTGHDGSLTTGHANTCKDMLSRLETMVLLGNTMPLDAVRRQICSGIDIIIHISKLRDKTRKIVEIVEILGIDKGNINLNTIYNYNQSKNNLCGELKKRKI